MQHDVDVAVIGSGFGGSVAALRLAQKGYRVTVVEEGRRWSASTLPRTSWDLRKHQWMPRLGCYGIQRMELLPDVFVVSGAGVGGGSLVYGNTLFVPKDSFFELDAIAQLGGAERLRPYYALAQKMMGVVPNPHLTEPDRVLRQAAGEYGRAHTFTPSPVGVYFGEPGREVDDPYFFGEGPRRSGCTTCGGCFVGCRENAKNTLDKNYLYFAEKLGARVLADTRVSRVEPLSPDGAAGYALTLEPSQRSWLHRRSGDRSGASTLRARAVVVAAGVLGTLRLLLGAKTRGDLPRLSERLGGGVRTNSETIVGVLARDRDVDYSRGIAASSSVFPDEHTQVQADRYPRGSDTLSMLATILVDGGPGSRVLRFAREALARPRDLLRTLAVRDVAQRTVLLVVMQDVDARLRLELVGGEKLSSRPEGGQPRQTYIPIGNDFARRMARRLDGVPLSVLTEVFLDRPVTAHVMGGCQMAARADDGVVDLAGRAFGYENLFVCDGSVLPANLGVNPALSILAFAEHIMARVPHRDGPRGRIKHLAAERRWGVTEILQP